MTQIRQDAIKLLEQIPEDKIIFIIQIMQGLKGLYTDDDMKEREDAFLHLEKMKRKRICFTASGRIASIFLKSRIL